MTKIPPLSNTWRKINRDAYKILAEELPEGNSIKYLLETGNESPYCLVFRKQKNNKHLFKAFYSTSPRKKVDYFDGMGKVVKSTSVHNENGTKYLFETDYTKPSASNLPKIIVSNNPDGTKTYRAIREDYYFANGDVLKQGDSFTTRAK